MLLGSIYVVMRMSLIALVCVCIWRYVQPRTQLMRVFRAALLVLSLFAIWAVVRITGL